MAEAYRVNHFSGIRMGGKQFGYGTVVSHERLAELGDERGIARLARIRSLEPTEIGTSTELNEGYDYRPPSVAQLEPRAAAEGGEYPRPAGSPPIEMPDPDEQTDEAELVAEDDEDRPLDDRLGADEQRPDAGGPAIEMPDPDEQTDESELVADDDPDRPLKERIGVRTDDDDDDTDESDTGTEAPAETVTTEVPVEGEEGFDPAEHTIDEVKAFVGDDYTLAEEVAEAERAGRNRSTLLDWLKNV